MRIAFAAHREAPHRDAVDLLDAGRPLVSPRHVVARAGRDDLDLRVPRQPLGDVARVQLGAAVDVGTVSLDDDCQLHDSWGPPPPRSGSGETSAYPPPDGSWVSRS